MLRFVFWDVQHGHATYLATPGGRHIAIDLGTGTYASSRAEFSPLLNLKQNWGVTELDGVLITHPHRDHLDDIVNFEELSPQVLWRSKHLSEADIRAGNRKDDSGIIDKYLEINDRYSATVPDGADPFLASNNGGVDFQVFTPRSCNTSNLNNHSMVAVITYAHSTMLIPGDNEPPSWKELLEREDFRLAIRNTDILLAPHHGRESGFSSELFEHINPRLCIISDGRFSDTSATDRYSKNSQGWTVHKRSGDKEERKCVTTRNDGVIVVKFGMNSSNEPFIEVTTG